MNKILKNKKIILGLCILFFIFYFLSSFDFAVAQEFAAPKLPTGPDLLPRATVGGKGLGTTLAITGSGLVNAAASAGSWGFILFGVLNLLSFSLEWFIAFGYGLLNTAVNLALDPNWFRIDAVHAAWRLVRDFVNVWFILILLVIAITTILRVSNYQAKKLLPTLIWVALVVNFSMPITGFVIDISNIVAFQFLQAICPEVKTNPADGCDFSGNLENGLNASALKSVTEETVESFGPAQETPKPGAFLIQNAHAEPLTILGVAVTASLIWKALSVLTAASFAYDLVKPFFFGESLFGGIAVGPFVSILVVTIFQAFTVFVILSMAILFLIRIISLMLIMILSPFGFAAMVLPATQKYASDWWDYLFRQSFFAPIALFFLWFALIFMKTIKDGITIAGQPFDFTNPTNLRLIFYVFSILLLYASLWISRKMGAIGAETIIKWGNTARSAITGFVGGLAARNLWAPIGAAGIARGIPETLAKIPLVGPLAGITAAEALRKIAKAGKAPEEAAAKAELGMRLSPADRGVYFAKLDRAAKEAMLRKMKAEERESLIAGLGAAEQTTARQILSSMAFKPEERASAEVEEFQRRLVPDQLTRFGTLSEEARKNFLMRFTDNDRRAEFIQKVKENGDADTANESIQFLEKDMRFTAGQQFEYKKARWKQELLVEDKKDNLAEFLDGITDDKLKENYFKTMDDRQRLAVMEKWHAEGKPLNTFVDLMGKLKPEEQDKFYRETVGRRASASALTGLVNVVPADKDKKKILSAASAEQMARVAMANPALVPITDEIAESGTMSERNRQTYYRNQVGRVPPRHPGGPGRAPFPAPTPVTPVTPATPVTAAQFVRTNNPRDIVTYLGTFDPEKDEAILNQAIAEIKSKPQEQQIEILRTLNPILRVRHVDNILFTKEEEFITKLSQNIKKTERIDFKDQIFENPSIISDPRFQQAFLRGGNTPKLLSLVRERPDAVEFIRDAVTKNMPTQDTKLHAEAIAERFENIFHNRELAIVLSDIRRAKKESLNETGKELKELLFE